MIRKLEFELCKSILKMWDYNKSRLYEQILKVETPILLENFFSFSTSELTLMKNSNTQSLSQTLKSNP
ncbi:hypothetical protein LEP1GSC062_0732 [Leptospira alexanderi serovar Manhao 3 str. L 60]|uniref:Uncharacterized protein n=1 Tax=Leptospira alexanderi serovar Manhao 3 str. L 60 TaxID=1049759 RepID=V6I2W2_9LEPT|nr:hypothetical protein LEP1GSC062_0732 [Leptospira alexanderi serovar Manhao 3 str. L 60]